MLHLLIIPTTFINNDFTFYVRVTKRLNKVNDSSNLKKIDNNMKFQNIHNMPILNIKGFKQNELYLGKIIEKGENYPTMLDLIKYINLKTFSEKYFGVKFDFQEISLDKDFEQNIKLVPLGNNKYIFSNIKSPKEDINKEENDLIILQEKVEKNTLYYLMKLTGQINGINEYTILKVKNNKKIIHHFKDSIGLNNGERFENCEDDDPIYEGIIYDIIENPDIE